MRNGVAVDQVEATGSSRLDESGVGVDTAGRHVGVAQQRQPLPPPGADVHDSRAGRVPRADDPAYVGQVPRQLLGDLVDRPPEAVGEVGVERGEARPAAVDLDA